MSPPKMLLLLELSLLRNFQGVYIVNYRSRYSLPSLLQSKPNLSQFYCMNVFIQSNWATDRPCTFLLLYLTPSLLPVEIPSPSRDSSDPTASITAPVTILSETLTVVFEHRAPFYRILHTWCQDTFPLCYLCFLFFNWCFKIFPCVYCLASLARPRYPCG